MWTSSKCCSEQDVSVSIRMSRRPPGVRTWLNLTRGHAGRSPAVLTVAWEKKKKNSVIVVLPGTFSEWFAALPPWHHAPRRHLGLALDERVSSHLHQRLAPQLAVREIWGNSWDKSSMLKLLFVKASHPFYSKRSLVIYLILRLIMFPPSSKMSLWINSLISMDNSH